MIWLLLAAADMQVKIDTTFLPTLRVELTLAEPAQRLCTAIIGGGRGIKGLKAMPDDPDCFQPASAYHVDLKALDGHDPDFATLMGKAWMWNDQAVILRPEPLPDRFDVELDINGPAFGVWPKKAGLYVANAAALDGGSYWGLGAWQPMSPLKVTGREVQLFKSTGREFKASDTVLRDWVERSLKAVAAFLGELPAARMAVFLAPVRLSSEGGVFGSIIRRHWATALLLFGANATAEAFAGDWMAVHELFHSVMPHIKGRPAWFVEGFCTYYQDVLRARAGLQTAAAMWDDLHDAIVRFCQPDGRSLDEESKSMRKTHHYQKVYWSGACLALSLDVTIRTRTQNAQSLDTVMQQAWKDSQATPLTESDMVERLDAAAGLQITEKMLLATQAIDFAPLYSSLGLVIKSQTHVELSPHNSVRDAIMSP